MSSSYPYAVSIAKIYYSQFDNKYQSMYLELNTEQNQLIRFVERIFFYLEDIRNWMRSNVVNKPTKNFADIASCLPVLLRTKGVFNEIWNQRQPRSLLSRCARVLRTKGTSATFQLDRRWKTIASPTRPPLARVVQVQLCSSEHRFIFLFVSFDSKYSEFFPIELTVLFFRILS